MVKISFNEHEEVTWIISERIKWMFNLNGGMSWHGDRSLWFKAGQLGFVWPLTLDMKEVRGVDAYLILAYWKDKSLGFLSFSGKVGSWRSTETVSSSLYLVMVVLDNSAWPVIYVVRANVLCCGKESHVSRHENRFARQTGLHGA